MTHQFTLKRFIRCSLLIFALSMLLSSPTLAKEDPRDNPLTIIKVGFLDHFKSTIVVLTDMKSYRRTTYTLAEEVRYTQELQDIEQNSIFVGSIINLYMIDGQVVEVELIQESS